MGARRDGCAPSPSRRRRRGGLAGLPETIHGEPRGAAYEPTEAEAPRRGPPCATSSRCPGPSRPRALARVPVGTRAWQEISVNGRRVETRLVERTGEGPRSWSIASWVWNREGTMATLAPLAGVRDVQGTGHDVPAAGACISCHAKGRQYLLGVRLDEGEDRSVAASTLDAR